MAIRYNGFRTITCNNEKCGKTITYEHDDRRPELEKAIFDAPENVWLKGVRQVTTLDNRMFAYCSDVCEVTGVGSGEHNIPEPKKMIESATAAQVQMAANAAKQAEEATKALKSGR